MVAAATTSLPERAERRPQLRLPLRLDPRPVLRRAGRRRGRAAPAARRRRPASSPTGCSPTAPTGARLHRHRRAGTRHQRQLDLPGYPGGTDIVGNWVNQQFQLDASARRCCCSPPPPATTGSTPTAGAPPTARRARSSSAGREPDAGIWELDDRALDAQPADLRRRAARDRPRLPGAGRQAARLAALADRIVADTAADACTPPALAARPRRPARRRGAAAAGRARRAAAPTTRAPSPPCAAVLAELTGDGYVYRFRHDDRPLAEAEGAFLLCGFLIALAAAPAGRAGRGAPAGSSAPGPPAGRRGCSPRSTTSTSTSCAATCPRPSSTPCCSRPPPGSGGRPGTRPAGCRGPSHPGPIPAGPHLAPSRQAAPPQDAL